MDSKYVIGIDTATSKSNGALVVAKHSSDGIEIIKVMKWYQKWQWLNRLRYKFLIWRLCFRYFRKVEVYMESNSPTPNKWYRDAKVTFNLFRK